MAESSGPERYAPRDQRPAETLDHPGPEQSGPEKYAPPRRSLLEVIGEAENITPVPELRSGRDASNDSDSPAEKLAEIIQRASSTSTNEIDLVIRTLDNVREMIRKEGQRVNAEIAAYVRLSRSATTAMKVIVENLKQWNHTSK
jgi:hypothetical protein